METVTIVSKVKREEGELNYREMQENVESWKRGDGRGGEGNDSNTRRERSREAGEKGWKWPLSPKLKEIRKLWWICCFLTGSAWTRGMNITLLGRGANLILLRLFGMER